MSLIRAYFFKRLTMENASYLAQRGATAKAINDVFVATFMIKVYEHLRRFIETNDDHEIAEADGCIRRMTNQFQQLSEITTLNTDLKQRATASAIRERDQIVSLRNSNYKDAYILMLSSRLTHYTFIKMTLMNEGNAQSYLREKYNEYVERCERLNGGYSTVRPDLENLRRFMVA